MQDDGRIMVRTFAFTSDWDWIHSWACSGGHAVVGIAKKCNVSVDEKMKKDG